MRVGLTIMLLSTSVSLSLPAPAKPTWKSARGIYVSFSVLITASFPVPTADTVSLVLLTSIWLPIPSHKARWNYNPTLHSSNSSYTSYLYFDKMGIFEHHKMMIIWSVTCSKVKRNTGERILSCFFFKLYASSQSDRITQ